MDRRRKITISLVILSLFLVMVGSVLAYTYTNTLLVDTVPTGAQIYAGGIYKGNSPVRITNLYDTETNNYHTILIDKLGYKEHWAVSDYLQRSARHIASKTDVEQAYALGAKAVEFALKLCLALNCKISPELIFSRKSYFYPDMAKNYQISQYEIPLGKGGKLRLKEGKEVGITRVHMEEDPASLVHPAGMKESQYVLVDYNRSGNPLVEIVTEPELESPDEARDFMKQILEFMPIEERTVVISESLHAIISHSHGSAGKTSTIEGGIVRIADALDMSKGRSRIPYSMGKIDIHSVSANAIESVIVKEGKDKPVEIRIVMTTEAGVFQVDDFVEEKLEVSGLTKYIEVKSFLKEHGKERTYKNYSS